MAAESDTQMVPAITLMSRTAYMVRGTDKRGPMAKAEDLFKKTQKHEHALSDIEKAKQADREKTARLKTLRLAKKVT